LATLSDGEETIIGAMESCWPNAPRQRCQSHFLGNLAEPVLEVDRQLQQGMRQEFKDLPSVPGALKAQTKESAGEQPIAAWVHSQNMTFDKWIKGGIIFTSRRL
jgi:hypothetical protein